MLALPGQSGSFGFGSRHGPSEGALDRLGAPLPRPVGGIDRGNKTALNPAPRRAIQAWVSGVVVVAVETKRTTRNIHALALP